MIPSFASGLLELSGLSAFDIFTIVSHGILGTLAEILGLVIVGFWLSKGPKKMACWKWRRWMAPTFIIWIISVVNGALVHVLGMV